MKPVYTWRIVAPDGIYILQGLHTEEVCESFHTSKHNQQVETSLMMSIYSTSQKSYYYFRILFLLDLSNQYDKSTQLAVISNPVDQLNALLTLHKALCRMRHGYLAIMMSGFFLGHNI